MWVFEIAAYLAKIFLNYLFQFIMGHVRNMTCGKNIFFKTDVNRDY